MIEPTEFSEIFIDCKNISNSYSSINTACQQAFYCYRFNIDKIKKLNKCLDTLTNSKDIIYNSLENIQGAFDKIDNEVIVYMHILEKVKNELLSLSIEDNTNIKEDIETITNYIEKF